MAEETTDGPSSKGDAASARGRLLDAGLELFGTIGYEATTIAALCRHAHVSTRDFYRHVGDRIKLFRLVFEREVQQNFERIDAALDSAPPVTAIVARRWMRAWLDAMKADPRRYRVLYTEAHGIDHELDVRRRQQLRSILELARDQLRRCIVSRGIEPGPTIDLAAIAVAAATRELLQQYMEGALPHIGPEDIVETATRLAILVDRYWEEDTAHHF